MLRKPKAEECQLHTILQLCWTAERTPPGLPSNCGVMGGWLRRLCTVVYRVALKVAKFLNVFNVCFFLGAAFSSKMGFDWHHSRRVNSRLVYIDVRKVKSVR